MLSPQLPLGLLPFCIHISLHSLQKMQVSRADGLGLGGQTSIPIPFLPPWTCNLSQLQSPHLDKGHNSLWRGTGELSEPGGF